MEISPKFERQHADLSAYTPNAVVISQASRKLAKLVECFLAFLKTQGLHAIYDGLKNRVVAYDSTLLDFHRINQIILRTPYLRARACWPTFQFKEQTLSCQADLLGAHTIKAEIPNFDEWAVILKESPHPILLSPKPLHLPCGKLVSLKDFVEHPLFKNTLEKYNVFQSLLSFVQKPNFKKSYEYFLRRIKLETWFEPYLSHLKYLTHLSLIAFLDGKIAQEDLFFIHMIASIIDESAEDLFQITILQKDNIEEYLTAANYPPFNTLFFYTDKTKEELQKAKQTVFSLLEQMSPIQRTCIAYPIDPLFDARQPSKSIEQGIFYRVRCPIGLNPIHQIKTGTHTVVLLSPSFCLELYRITSSLQEPPPSNYTWMFGCSTNASSLESLKEGRPISIASPLYAIPYVHKCSQGKQIGITVHDILYHLAIDWQNPHCRLFIQLAQVIGTWPNLDEATKRFRIDLLDREFNLYRERSLYDDRERCLFWESLHHTLADHPLSESMQIRLISALKQLLSPTFFSPSILQNVKTHIEREIIFSDDGAILVPSTVFLRRVIEDNPFFFISLDLLDSDISY